MKVVEITRKETLELMRNTPSYFLNQCLFNSETNELIVFSRKVVDEFYEDIFHCTYKYYKIIEED